MITIPIRIELKFALYSGTNTIGVLLYDNTIVTIYTGYLSNTF